MKILQSIKPKFWDIKASTSHYETLYNYRRFWLSSLSLRIIVSLVPLGIFTVLSFSLAYEAIKSENLLRTARITSNTRREVNYFLKERLDALRFIIQEKNASILKNDVALGYLLRDLKRGFGGLVDLGLIDDSGKQAHYAGPYDLRGKDYSKQKWFIRCVNDGSYISNIFMGYRKSPHMIIAVKWPGKNGSFHILRATLDIEKIIQLLSSLDLSERSEAFLCDHNGVLQTPSKYYGSVLKKINLPIPPHSAQTQVIEAVDSKENKLLIGYAYIQNSPYILMIVKQSKEIMKGWYSLRDKMIWIFCGSFALIVIVSVWLSTFMQNKIYDADQKRLEAIERLDSSSRLISLGRLAAGVAHEINNPLAVINENAGLISDLFYLKKEYQEDTQLTELIEAVLESVERCGAITKQLLGFARDFEPKIALIRVKKVVSDVLSFLRKEALYRNISINVDIPEDLPMIHADQGSLQQILLNLINNALQAMSDGGHLDILVKKNQNEVKVSIKDDGCGISADDQKKIFEPFFTTKDLKGGTGLGLSITYGLVKKFGGDISVKSKIGDGATFIITLPIKYEGDVQNENPTR